METRRKQSPEQLAYLAGVIDSDGYIGILKDRKLRDGRKHPSYGLTLNVTNTSRELMDWLVDNFKGKIYLRKLDPTKNWKQTYNWIVGYQNAKDILEMIEKYLVIKRQQALLGIELMNGWITDNRGTPPEELTRRERIYRSFLELNSTGLVQRERLNSEAPLIEDEAIV